VFRRSMFFRAGGALLALTMASAASAQITVYNNFAGPNHDGWDYNWGLGWSIAGPESNNDFGVEQAMGFFPTAGGNVSDIWVAMWYVPSDPQPDVVTLRLVSGEVGLPPDPANVMEEWIITEFESWYQWNPPIHLLGNGTSYLEEGRFYWLWASGDETTWCGWCMNLDPSLTCPHTLRRENEDWLPVDDETASAFRVDVIDPYACPADFDDDGDVDTADLLFLLAAWGTPDGDVDGDDDTDTADLLALLAAWGDCPSPPCPWDFNGDDMVDEADQDILMAHWGDCPDPPEECPWDLNGDGVVDGVDLMELLNHFGPCP